jgi:hypothetical protein
MQSNVSNLSRASSSANQHLAQAVKSRFQPKEPKQMVVDYDNQASSSSTKTLSKRNKKAKTSAAIIIEPD